MSEIHCQFCEKICLNGFLDCSHTAHQKCLEENGECLYCQLNSIDNNNVQVPVQNDVPNVVPQLKKVKRTKRIKHECTICLCEITKKHKVHVIHKFKIYFQGI